MSWELNLKLQVLISFGPGWSQYLFQPWGSDSKAGCDDSIVGKGRSRVREYWGASGEARGRQWSYDQCAQLLTVFLAASVLEPLASYPAPPVGKYEPGIKVRQQEGLSTVRELRKLRHLFPGWAPRERISSDDVTSQLKTVL